MNTQPFELLKAFVRLLGLSYFLSAVEMLTYLPNDVMGLLGSSPIAQRAMISTIELLVRFCFYLGLALAFWFWAAHLARFVGKGLSSDSNDSGTAAHNA